MPNDNDWDSPQEIEARRVMQADYEWDMMRRMDLEDAMELVNAAKQNAVNAANAALWGK